MRAATAPVYGGPDVVRVSTLPDPVPGPPDLLVRNRASTLAAAGGAARAGPPRFAVGDRVTALTRMGAGAHAELVVVPDASAVVPTPDALTDVDAAVLAAGPLTALPFLTDHATVRPGTRVLVVGASGCVGTAAVQVAAHAGAHVTAVTGPRGLDLARALGAAEVVDRTVRDVTAPEADDPGR